MTIKVLKNGSSLDLQDEEEVPDCLVPSVVTTERELPSRGTWVGKLDFLFSCISYAVGLGNVWRFPYLCYENGGGAFLIPYFLCLILCAVPLFMMEVALGQYLSIGGIGVWNIVPILKGIGFASMTIVFLYNVYYVVIIAWSLVYLVSSFSSVLPWKNCADSWKTVLCDNATAANITGLNLGTTSVAEFWERRVLGQTTGLHELGSLRWELALYLLLAWALVYLVIWRGLHQSGKVMWFTSIFPYVILTILFFRGVTLQGASKGLSYYITPVWSKLYEAQVWIAAGSQVFFTFGIGFGSVITLGSYNKYHHNFYKDSLILCVVNPFTSLFAGTVIFSVLGYMAETQGVEVAQVVKSGPGLAFLAYPEVVVQLPISPLWSVLFFLMLIILGIDSQFCTVEALVTGIVDEWPQLLRPRRKLFTLCTCIALYLLGLPMITDGGIYLFQLMDTNSASGVSLLFTVFFQTIAVAWIYGANKLSDNMEDMLGSRPGVFFRISWVVLVPVITMSIFLFSVIRYKPLVYAGTYTYPYWGQMIGWGIALASMCWIPCYAVFYMLTTPGTFMERLVSGTTSSIKPKHDSASSSPDKDTELSSITSNSSSNSSRDLSPYVVCTNL